MYFRHIKNWQTLNIRIGLKNLNKIHKNEKKLQFYGVKQSKIQWMNLKIILIKDKNFTKKLQTLNLKVGLRKSGRNT